MMNELQNKTTKHINRVYNTLKKQTKKTYCVVSKESRAVSTTKKKGEM
jgi:hypothetical protein